MILQDASLILWSQAGSYLFALLGRQYNASEVLVYRLVIVEQASVLRQDVDLLSEHRPRLPVQGMAVSRRLDFWSSSVDAVGHHLQRSARHITE